MPDAVTPSPSKRARTSGVVMREHQIQKRSAGRGLLALHMTTAARLLHVLLSALSQTCREVLKVGCTPLYPLVLGGDAAKLTQRNLLAIEYFFVGELVSVKREDLRRTVGLLRAVHADTIEVDCGECVIKTIPVTQAPECLGKLLRAHYLAAGPCAPPRLARTFGSKAHEVELGGTTLRPVHLGQDCQSLPRRGGLGIDHYYKCELVAVVGSDGRIVIGEIVEITSQGAVVATVSGSEWVIARAEVRSTISKLLGNYYLAASLKRHAPTGSSGRTADRIQEQFAEYSRRQDSDKIQGVFTKYGSVDHGVNCIPEARLLDALNDLQIHAEEDEVLNILGAVDGKAVDGKEGCFVGLEELKSALFPPSPVESWAHSLHLPRLLSFVLPGTLDPKKEPLLTVAMLKKADIETVTTFFCKAVSDKLTKEIRRLQSSFEAMDKSVAQAGNEKFNVVKMSSCGSIEDFHLGLHSRIGPTRIDSDFVQEMEAEHCTKVGFDRVINAQSLRKQTTPKAEWELVVKRMECPKEHMSSDRRIPDIDDLLKLSDAKNSKLTRSEVIGLVMYTGPMYQVYNTILRRHPPEEYEIYKNDGNLFCTTISVIVSALIKISRSVKVREGKLYRGLGGTKELPDSFFKADVNGCKGFTEWGFMSTSSNKSVAIAYSGVEKRRPVPQVLELRVGSVDRGANIEPFSQFQNQNEFLFVPCSFLQQEGQEYLEVTTTGVVRVFPVRVNSNLKAMTLEEQIEQRKKIHITSFKLLIDSISENLYDIARDRQANARLEIDTTWDRNQKVEGFLSQIVEQCKQVLARHEAASASEYSEYHVYQCLVREMVDVKGMAIAKLEEWLENKSSSFIRVRWNAPLRTAYRRWMAYLEKELLRVSAADGRKEAAIRLCKVKRLIADSADEKNELGETKLMEAAAEGFGERILRLLVVAAADVNCARPDGVTPVWLAAQFGHAECINTLHQLKCDVRKAANDGATPIYIAAQNGNEDCIKLLESLKADVNMADFKGLTPVHQAALNGWVECIKTLHELGANLVTKANDGTTPAALAHAHGRTESVEKLHQLNSSSEIDFDFAVVQRARSSLGSKGLIISTGDISDVDGFYALAHYAKSGADVLFVMNYPAYIGVNDVNEKYAESNPGLGYRYTATQVLTRDSDAESSTEYRDYREFLSRYKNLSDNEKMKCALTDIAYKLAYSVWQEVQGNPGQLFFCIGGINSVNPFSANAIKNEALAYSHLVSSSEQPRIPPSEGIIYDKSGVKCEVRWSQYTDIYIDFNGSMAFWNELWVNKLSDRDTAGKIRGAFVMGGVYADRPPLTMPSIPGVLNRFSSATMNQLYHPQRSAEFFAFLKQNKIDTFTITNNVIGDLTTWDPDGTTKTYDGVLKFLKSNNLTGEFLQKIAYAHYHRKYKAPRKAFDFYTALALTTRMHQAKADMLKSQHKTLLHSNVYGMTFVSDEDTWEATRCSYIRNIDTTPNAKDSQTTSAKKESFLQEIESMNRIAHLEAMTVFNVEFVLDESSMCLSVAAPAADSRGP